MFNNVRSWPEDATPVGLQCAFAILRRPHWTSSFIDSHQNQASVGLRHSFHQKHIARSQAPKGPGSKTSACRIFTPRSFRQIAGKVILHYTKTLSLTSYTHSRRVVAFYECGYRRCLALVNRCIVNEEQVSIQYCRQPHCDASAIPFR